MDTNSLINRQFKIHYARSREIEQAAGNGGASTKKPKISTKEWVFSTFYPGAKAGKSFASVHAVTEGGAVVAANDKITEARPLPKDDSNRSHEPAVSFTQVVIDSAAEKFKFSLVGKFYRSRPSLELTRKWVSAKLRLVGQWSVTLLDRNHVLIKLDNEDDMLRIWPRSRWFVRGHLMKVFKWTPDFRPSDGEPSTAPVWISFPSLPVVYFEQDLLYAIASLLGRVLSMDVPTRRLSRTNVARVCVEVDLLNEHPHQVWIGVENGGFWQAVKYERLPSYCTNCRQQGHSAVICKRKRNTGTSRILEMEETKSMNQKPHLGIKEEKHDMQHLNVEKHYQTCPSLLEKDRRGNLVINSASHRTLNSLTCKQQVKEGKVEGKGVCNEEEPDFSNGGSRKKDNNSILTIGSFSKENVSMIEEKLWRSVEMPHKGKSLIQEEIKEVEEEEEFDDDQEQKEAEDEEVQEAEKLVNSKEEKGGKQEIVPSNLAADYQKEQKQIERGANNGLPKQSPHAGGKKKTLFFWKKRSKQWEDVNDLAEFPYSNVRRFALRELCDATDGFSAGNILGRGGFGKVFKGRLADGFLVAVKRLKEERTPGGELQFQTEVQIRGIAVHKNLLPLVGICMTSTERILVYPYMANRDVSSYLRDHAPNVLPLNWTIRKSIAVGTAQGLSYLHEQINPKILHRDVKASNILLNEEFEPLICDFGLAKAMPFEDIYVTTAVRGTIGHIAPEYLSYGKASQKTDVFGYGITLLELVTGQRAFDLARLANDEDVMLLDWVKELLKMNCLDRIVDPNLYGVYNVAELSQLVSIALLCTKSFPKERPIMSEVVRMLEEKVLGGIEPQPLNVQNLEQAVDLFTNHADASSNTDRKILDKETVGDGEKSVTTEVASISSEIGLPR